MKARSLQPGDVPDPRPGVARPRHAASLVVAKGRGRGLRVLMGRREPRHRFMPDVFVFPGGRLDASDAYAVAHRELPARTFRPLAARWGPRLARGLAVAALRETWEETHLSFGRVVDGCLLPDLSGISYLARAITPVANPTRFHARFFSARAGDARGRIGGSGELLELEFYPVAEAMKLPIVDVTAVVLEELLRRERGAESGTAFVHYRSFALHVRREAPDGTTLPGSQRGRST